MKWSAAVQEKLGEGLEKLKDQLLEVSGCIPKLMDGQQHQETINEIEQWLCEVLHGAMVVLGKPRGPLKKQIPYWSLKLHELLEDSHQLHQEWSRHGKQVNCPWRKKYDEARCLLQKAE